MLSQCSRNSQNMICCRTYISTCCKTCRLRQSDKSQERGRHTFPALFSASKMSAHEASIEPWNFENGNSDQEGKGCVLSEPFYSLGRRFCKISYDSSTAACLTSYRGIFQKTLDETLRIKSPIQTVQGTAPGYQGGLVKYFLRVTQTCVGSTAACLAV